MAQAFIGFGLGITIVGLFMGLLFVMAALERASEPVRQQSVPVRPPTPAVSIEPRREPPAAELEPARAA